MDWKLTFLKLGCAMNRKKKIEINAQLLFTMLRAPKIIPDFRIVLDSEIMLIFRYKVSSINIYCIAVVGVLVVKGKNCVTSLKCYFS